jgi:hypothetical protein
MNCRDRATKVRNFQKEQRSDEHQIFDNWGRIQSQ